MSIQTYTTDKGEGLLLHANENSLNLPDQVRNEIAARIRCLDFNRYPDTDSTRLRSQYAGIVGKKPTQILAGNGSDQMLGLLITALCGPGKTLLTVSQDFSMYDYYASTCGTRVIKDDTLSADCDMILFSNPNNPTGQIRTRAEIESLLQSVSVPVVVDEAYMDFADESVLDLVDTYPNLYVTRTLSKAWRAAGIRCGFLISSMENIARLEPVNVPYSVNAMSQEAACVILSHLDELKGAVRTIITERDNLHQALCQLGLPVRPSAANFLYVEEERVPRIVEALKQQGIQVRSWPGEPRMRITIGTPEENARLLRAIQEAL